MALKIRKESALNLTLEGSTGSFSVGTGRDGQNSLEVKYFLTHVGLDFSSISDEALLSHLAPVREIFDFKQLDFDEIMQRDIDDARVSSELIPYLLDEKSVDLVKLFPPIVVVVLPVKEGENRPADLYPKVYEEETLEQNDEAAKYILRAGAIGQEVFQFEQPIDEGQRLKHDLVRFRINTHKTRLVIVDGQHRAMALLAIYRNLKDQWSDEKRAPFKEYYSEWTPKYIQQFNLKEINLPVILCTFPSLNETYAGDFNLKKAARSIFLTLNKTARKVSNSRNILLDDQDIIAYFLRRCLSEVKGKDQRSPYSLRISNVELDQSEDKLKIKSPIAITGVNHLYYIIEHLLLNSGDEVEGVKPRSGKISKRKDLNGYNCMDRLNGRNLLGSEVADLTTRDNFSQDSANKLGSSFDKSYGTFIIAVLERFAPYENHNKAVLNLENSIEIYQDRQLRPILLEGQGIGRVFETHRDNLKQKFKDTKVPEIQSITQRLDATAKRIEQAIQDFRVDRTKLYIQPISDKSKLKNLEGSDINPNIVKWFNDLYDNVLTTVAFQSGLICGFFGEIEKTNTELDKESQAPLNIIECFNEYIEQLNDFFTPKTSNQFKKLIRVFTGDISGEIVDWKIISINSTFRNVVYSGEMQPDQWTKYKYLFLEIWKPKHPKLNENLIKERQKCREQIYAALHNYYKTLYCQEHSKLEENLERDEMKSIFNQAFSAYSDFLKNLSAEGLNEQDMKVAISTIPAKTIDEVEAEEA
ncbi:DNA sulfur modification protein DndB [Scytonema sp. NUACC26]|uniref:DNA sulfur modification protein DndB n=1 Tax=Scytonema sp. NUACC26 TaxID=3140176 RepID=UPI0034DBE8AB